MELPSRHQEPSEGFFDEGLFGEGRFGIDTLGAESSSCAASPFLIVCAVSEGSFRFKIVRETWKGARQRNFYVVVYLWQVSL